MQTFNALYYPTWNPSAEFLRGALLFFDRFEVIIPTDVPAKYDEENSRIIELLPDVFVERRERRYEIDLDDAGWRRFEKALDLLVEERPPAEEISVDVNLGGLLRIEDHVFTHDAKLNHHIKNLLQERRLLRPEADWVVDAFGREGFHVVDERASSLILSLLADTLARRNRLRTLTDEPLGYTLNSLNYEHPVLRQNVEAKLASAIITAEIPETIGVLSAEDYVELRKRFEGIRAPFQRAVRELYDNHMLDSASHEGELRDAIMGISLDYGRVVARFRNSRYSKGLKTWTSLGLGSLGTALSLTGNWTLGAIGSGLGVAVQYFDKFTADKPEGCIEQSQRLICGLRQELLNPKLVQKLAGVV